MAGSKLLISQMRMYVIEKAQSMGESCPILNFTINARTGSIKGSVTKQEIAYIRLSIGSVKKGRSIRIIMVNETTSSTRDTVFAKI